MGTNRFCTCTRCKKAARKGLVLGSRKEGYWTQGVFGFGSVSAYIRHPRFMKRKKEMKYAD